MRSMLHYILISSLGLFFVLICVIWNVIDIARFINLLIASWIISILIHFNIAVLYSIISL